MAKRIKRAKIGADSIFKEIKRHFKKFDEMSKRGDIIGRDYALKELETKFIPQFEKKVKISGKGDLRVGKVKDRLKLLEKYSKL